MNRYNEICLAIGLQKMYGYRLRIEGTSHPLLPSEELWLVMVIDRWTLDTFPIYWSKVEEILPDFTSKPLMRFRLISRMSRIGTAIHD